MDNWIQDNEIVFDCGCTFPIVSRDPLRWKVPTDITKITKHCKRTWDLFATGNTKGIFQLETRFGQQSSKKLMPECIEHLSGLMAVLRPGALQSLSEGKSVTERYFDRKNGLEEVELFHESLRPILESTYGVLCYQEQSMKIAQDIAGFDLQKSDTLRKSIGKKIAELMSQLESEFIDGCVKTGIVDKETAETIFGWIKVSQRYQFNKCLSPTTTVNTKTETKTIDELEIGEYIDSPYGYVEVIDKYENGEQELYEVELQNGKIIECTMNHKFLCEDNIVRPLHEILDIGCSIVCE